MSLVLRSLLFCVFLQYATTQVYETTYHKQQIKIREIDPERRPLYQLNPKDSLDKHFLLSMRSYLGENDVIGTIGGKLETIVRSPKPQFLEDKDLWSWNDNYKDYKPANVELDAQYQDLNRRLKASPWFEQPIGAERTVDKSPFKVQEFFLRPDMEPALPRTSFELPKGFENTTDPVKIAQYRRHPLGRTGVDLKGLLGNWLATLAADMYWIKALIQDNIPVFDDEGVLVFKFLLMDRADGGGNASTGGIVEPTGETPLEAAAREGQEELTGIPTTDEIEALKKEISNLQADISKLVDGTAKTEKEITLKAKTAELAKKVKDAKNDSIKKIVEDKIRETNSEGLVKGVWCLYKGHAGDRRDADYSRMETVVFVYDFTLSTSVIPDEFTGSVEVKGKPRFVVVNETWLKSNKTFAKHGDYMRMIIKYILPLRSKELQKILPWAGEGLATAAIRALGNVVKDANKAISSLKAIPDYIITHFVPVIETQVEKANESLENLKRVVEQAKKNRINGTPQPGAESEKMALYAGKSAFEIVKEIKQNLAKIPELAPRKSPVENEVLIKETGAVITGIVAAYQQIQYYLSSDGEKTDLLKLSKSLRREFFRARHFVKTGQSNGHEVAEVDETLTAEEKSRNRERAHAEEEFTEEERLMQAKENLSVAEDKIRKLRDISFGVV